MAGSASDTLVLFDLVDTLVKLVDNRYVIIPGIPELLQALNNEGATLGVVTSDTSNSASNFMEGAGLRTLFTVFVGSDNSDEHKNRMSIAVREAERKKQLKFNPQRIFCIDDREPRCIMSHELGFKAIGVSTGSTPYQYLKRLKDVGLAHDAFRDLTDTKAVLAVITAKNATSAKRPKLKA
jgi:phosphoglycolate phosphatase-like HAD superfamily hydrolase